MVTSTVTPSAIYRVVNSGRLASPGSDFRGVPLSGGWTWTNDRTTGEENTCDGAEPPSKTQAAPPPPHRRASAAGDPGRRRKAAEPGWSRFNPAARRCARRRRVAPHRAPSLRQPRRAGARGGRARVRDPAERAGRRVSDGANGRTRDRTPADPRFSDAGRARIRSLAGVVDALRRTPKTDDRPDPGGRGSGARQPPAPWRQVLQLRRHAVRHDAGRSDHVRRRAGRRESARKRWAFLRSRRSPALSRLARQVDRRARRASLPPGPAAIGADSPLQRRPRAGILLKCSVQNPASSR